MSYVLDSGDALRIVIIGVVVLLALGTALAWVPAFRFDPMVIPARLFLAVSAVTIAADARGVGLVLGIGLALLSVLLWWRTQPEPEIPRPHLQGVFIAVLVTAVAVTAALNGWFWFSRIPDAAAAAVGLAIGAIGALGTLAVADRARIRERDAIRRRFHPVQPNPLLVGLDEDEQADEQSFPRPRRPGDVMAIEVSGFNAEPAAPVTTSATQVARDSTGDTERVAAEQGGTSASTASHTVVQTEPDRPPDSQAEPRLPRPTTPPDTDDGATASAVPENDERPSAQAPGSGPQDPEPSRQVGHEPSEEPDDVAAVTTTTESTGSARTVAEGEPPASGSAATATSSTKTSGSSKKRPGGTTRPAKKTATKVPSNAGASPSASGQGAAKKGASKTSSRATTSDDTTSDDTNGDGSDGDETSGAAAYVSTTANSDHAEASNGDVGSGTDGTGGTANGKASADGNSNGAASKKRTTANGATGNGKARAEKASSAPEQHPSTTQETPPSQEQ